VVANGGELNEVTGIPAEVESEVNGLLSWAQLPIEEQRVQALISLAPKQQIIQRLFLLIF
jgi:hypothetical protein